MGSFFLLSAGQNKERQEEKSMLKHGSSFFFFRLEPKTSCSKASTKTRLSGTPSEHERVGLQSRCQNRHLTPILSSTLNTTDKKLRAGIIGFGKMGRIRAKALEEHGGAEIISVFGCKLPPITWKPLSKSVAPKCISS